MIKLAQRFLEGAKALEASLETDMADVKTKEGFITAERPTGKYRLELIWQE